MVFRRSSRNERARPPRGAPRAKLAATLAPVLGLLAFAGAAHAQTGISLDPDGAQVLPAAAAVQTSQAAQAAAAQATTVQQAPTNIAIQIIVNSPGSNPVITQTNSAASGAAAGNTSAATQAAGLQQGTQGTPSGGGTAAAAGQSSSAAQDAASQATTQQGGATNVSVVTVVGSPSAAPAVSQTNGAASGAMAANTSSTTQVAGQTQAGAGAQQSAQPDAQPAGGALPSQSQPAGTSTQQGLGDLLPGPTGVSSVLTWISSWDWIWTAVPLPSFPSLPELEILLPGGIPLPGGLPGVPLPDSDGSAGGKGAPARADARDGKRAGDRSDAGLPAWSIQPPFPSLFAAATGSGGSDLSSRFVQRRSGAGTIARTQLRPSERPPVSPGTFAGGGSAAATFGASGLILGALLLIALQLVSAATALSRRFDLASAAWRRQAYLSPLERPG